MPDCEKSPFLPEKASPHLRELVWAVLRARADPQQCIDYFHDDAVLHMIGRIYDYSFSGVYRGKAQILDLFRRVDAEVELSDHKILNLIVDDGRAGLRRSVHVRHYGTAAEASLVIGNFVVFRESRIARAWEYADTAWLKKLSGDEN